MLAICVSHFITISPVYNKFKAMISLNLLNASKIGQDLTENSKCPGNVNTNLQLKGTKFVCVSTRKGENKVYIMQPYVCVCVNV